MSISVFAPAHISGFFQPCVRRDPEKSGSRNCGPCLKLGVLTEVSAEPSHKTEIEISINGRQTKTALTSFSAAKKVLAMTAAHWKIKIAHICQIPIGAGYGASGAGALGATFGTARALHLNLSPEKLVSIAHAAEVACHTGLGDVGAQATGGLVISREPGGPPWGIWQRIPVPKDLWVVCCTLGKIKTSSCLKDKEFLKRAQVLGKSAVNAILKSPTPENFLRLSKEFAEKLGLLDRELSELIKISEKAGAIGASQTMLGRGIFAFATSKTKNSVRRALQETCGEKPTFTTKIYSKALLVNNLVKGQP
ncbi:MAG: pantoate kinase [Candidatus Hadarchaeales archaeon]